MKIEGRQLFVWASIDGHAPMPFILDTGGHAILTTGAAKTLGLTTSGAGESGGAAAGTISLQYTRVKSIRLGSAELLDQPMLVIPYPYEFYERGLRQPLAGILGLEVFERFAARIDYGGGTLTLSPLSTFAYHGTGTAVPLGFQDDMPMIHAAADGHTGMFGTDTGNAGPLILFGDFLARTGLGEEYRGGTLVIGHGTGGNNSGRLEKLHSYTIGGHTIRNVRTDFTNMQKGAFSSWTEAGNVGYEVLSRFIPTYDYAAQTLYLDPCVHSCGPAPNRAGMAFDKTEPNAFIVATVVPNGAAARAGILAGDRIVAIDGKPARDYSRADLLELVAAPAGTSLRLAVLHGSGETVRVMTLR
jgi:membrane-associated protease RseP (regulator of RpoE activity)